MKKVQIGFFLLLVTAVVFGRSVARVQTDGQQQYVSPWRTPWTYEGAADWSDLDAEYGPCNHGKEQSPIDIREPKHANLPALLFESAIVPLGYVINNRHTIRVDYGPGNSNFLLVAGKRYELTQFHFHRPSEEYIHGKPYEMEVHLMYKAAGGEVAGVTVFVRPGGANPTIQTIWEHMPKIEGQVEARRKEISPGGLLPRNTAAYYAYRGSLTAPPCTEGITWFVLKTPIEMSPEQIDAFGKLYPNNVRPIQPLNGRVVEDSQ